MKRIYIVLASVVITLSACNKDLSSLNDNIKSPGEGLVPASSLFTDGLKNLVDNITTCNVNSNIFRLLSQYWTETTYTDESNYDLATRNISDNWWRNQYRFVLVNLEEAKKYIPAQVTDADVKKNQLAILDIVEVYTFSTLITTYGNVPYSKALDINNLFPAYDDAKTIHADLLKRLDADIANLNTSAAGFGSTADILLGDNIAGWKLFANGLKLRLGILVADSDPATAKVAIESAAKAVLASNADNVVFKYLATTPNNNPVWGDQPNSKRADFIATNTFTDLLTSLNDPRLPFFFDTATTAGLGYQGGEVGAGGSYAKNAHPASATVYAVDAPSTLLSYSETEFILAEAAERGYNVGGTAESHYNNAVTASILEWGGTAADAAKYLTDPNVAYASASGDYKQKIGTQKWIALYNRGFDAWVENRRLDQPALPTPVGALFEYPVRYAYPVTEQNLNAPNWKTAGAAIGGDKVTTKLFWDKF